MILNYPELSYISYKQTVHDKKFLALIRTLTVVNEINLNNTSQKLTLENFGESKLIVASTLTAGINAIDMSVKIPIIGICMAYEINEESKDPAIHTQLILNISRCFAIVCDSIYIENLIKKEFNFSKAIMRFPYGCNQSDLLSISFEEQKILRIVGTRTWTKLHSNETILEVLILLNQKNINYLATLYGANSEDKRNFNKSIDNLNRNKVKFYPPFNNSDLPEIFEENEIYLSAALSDGTSVSLLEALTAGRICIVRDFPANREWITHGVTGFLFQDLDHLLEILVQINDMSSLQRKLISDSARKSVVERANWEINGNKFLEFIEKLIK